MKINQWRKLLSFVLLDLTFSLPALAQKNSNLSLSEVNYQFYLTENDLVLESRDGYDLIDLKDGERIGEIGRPDLPMKLVHLLLPNYSEVESLIIINKSYKTMEGGYLIFPAQPDEKTNGVMEKTWVPLDSEIYHSDSLYPGKLAGIVESGYLAGNRIVTLALYPLQYRPRSKELLLYTDLSLQLKLRSSNRASPSSMVKRRTLQASKIYNEILNEIVDNKSDLPNYAFQTPD